MEEEGEKNKYRVISQISSFQFLSAYLEPYANKVEKNSDTMRNKCVSSGVMTF